MIQLTQRVKTADWKTEKHVPVIECASQVPKGEPLEVKVSLGKELAHPNTTQHHIRWISLYFQPQGEAAPYHVGHFEFAAHGEATTGPNEGPVHTDHRVTCTMTTTVPGTLMALAYCNIHGLWESSRDIKVE